MLGFGNFLPPLLVFFLILRRGFKPRRIRHNRLWVYPVVITLLALAALSHEKTPDLVTLAVFAGALVVGGALGWFTTRHIELTLDDKTGTVMSQPTVFGTVATASVFLARFLVDTFTGSSNGDGWKTFAVQHGANLALITDAGLLFVAARGLAQAWHMEARIRPMLAAHKASQADQISAG